MALPPGPDWQGDVVAAQRLGETPGGVGERASVTRKFGGREMTTTCDLFDVQTPRSFRVRDIDGPVRSRVHGTVEPLDDGRRSRLTLSLDFEGHGVGRALVPLVVRRQARKELPENERHLKRILEATG
ncbi:SRPBCC family protein [Streptomyces sp. JJ38]|uniref:SRPBCC family protein n=1 Tax=Streptomyces sp. JJ38 TaxID=2738128 RepID=UPI001C596D55|nr:SRPBCC family protein [Streptomyces sp. JJ38]MBW1600352.1 hypothetical protein [Streptomyces sp. JJ38]